jgi:hypothetical protein
MLKKYDILVIFLTKKVHFDLYAGRLLRGSTYTRVYTVVCLKTEFIKLPPRDVPSTSEASSSLPEAEFLVIFGASSFPARHKVYRKNIEEFVLS